MKPAATSVWRFSTATGPSAITPFQEMLKLNPGDTVTQGLLAKAREMAKLQPSGK